VKSRGALAGIAAAAAWAAAEPIVRRLAGTGYTDVRLLGRLVTRGRRWRLAGITVHLANGAVFGTAFEQLGRRGWRQGVLAAEVENIVLWPGMAVMDRIHPDRKNGHWPPLFSNGRVFAQEAAVHALFGLVLGLLVDDKRE
jgi:hypothetical protein